MLGRLPQNDRSGCDGRNKGQGGGSAFERLDEVVKALGGDHGALQKPVTARSLLPSA